MPDYDFLEDMLQAAENFWQASETDVDRAAEVLREFYRGQGAVVHIQAIQKLGCADDELYVYIVNFSVDAPQLCHSCGTRHSHAAEVAIVQHNGIFEYMENEGMTHFAGNRVTNDGHHWSQNVFATKKLEDLPHDERVAAAQSMLKLAQGMLERAEAILIAENVLPVDVNVDWSQVSVTHLTIDEPHRRPGIFARIICWLRRLCEEDNDE